MLNNVKLPVPRKRPNDLDKTNKDVTDSDWSVVYFGRVQAEVNILQLNINELVSGWKFLQPASK